MHEHLRQSLLTWWSLLVSRRPRLVLAAATIAAAAAIGVAVLGMGFQSDRNQLISPSLEWNARFLQWQAEFPGKYDLLVVVDTWPSDDGPTPEATATARDLVERLGPVLQADPHIEQAVWELSRLQTSPRALRLLPMGAFDARLSQLGQSVDLLAAPTPVGLMERITGQIGTRGALAAMWGNEPGVKDAAANSLARRLDDLTAVIDAMGVRLAASDAPAEFDDDPTLAQLLGEMDRQPQYLTSPNGRLMYIRVTPQRVESINFLGDAISAVRARVSEISREFPGVDVGVTGIEVIESDETAAALRDSVLASCLAFVLIAAVLVIAFHSFRTPLLTMTALLYGIAWTFGFLTLAIGHLQVISVVFTVILLGLGIAYGIHIASRFELVRHNYPDTAEGFAHAIRDSLQTVGPGILTGALTTAAAFSTTLLTDYRGVAEMGLIAAVGVLLCLVAMVSVFPALLRLFKPTHAQIKPMTDRRVHLFNERWLIPAARRSGLTLTLTAIVTAAAFYASLQLSFDFNLLNLQPADAPGVKWQRKIAEDGEQSVYFAVSLCDDLTDARAKAAAFEALPTVERVGGIAMLFPENEPEKVRKLMAMRQTLEPHLDPVLEAGEGADDAQASQSRAMLREQLTLMRSAMNAALPADQALAEPLAASLQRLRGAIDRTVATLDTLGARVFEVRYQRLVEEYQAYRLHTARRIAEALDPAPLTPADLPEPVIQPYVHPDAPPRNAYALEIYPAAGPAGPLDRAFLPRFMSEVTKIDPQVTGAMPQIYWSGELILRAYVLAGAYALAAVFVLLLLDFQRVSDAILALVPVMIGFAATFAILWVLGMSINAANIIVLPLMFGIGVDSGVHMLHRYRQDPRTPPRGLTDGTGKGIAVTSLTTVLGFASMLIASHRGVQSLGFVLAAGVALTLVACLFVMPALLRVLEKLQPRTETLPPGRLRSDAMSSDA